MIWIYIVSWTLIFDGGSYGNLDGNFEKRFMNRSEAVVFMEWPKATTKKIAFKCENFQLDSTLIDTSTVKKDSYKCDSIIFPRWDNIQGVQWLYRGNNTTLRYIEDGVK